MQPKLASLVLLLAVLGSGCSAGGESPAQSQSPSRGDRLKSDVIKRHPWYGNLPVELRNSLLDCVKKKGDADILAEHNTLQPSTHLEPAARFDHELKAIEAREDAALEQFCPQTLSDVRSYVF